MKYLIRFTQLHESFRLAEIQALATLANADLKVLHYDAEVSEGHCDHDPSIPLHGWLAH
jgi:tRNA G10  N-methylase Trm11